MRRLRLVSDEWDFIVKVRPAFLILLTGCALGALAGPVRAAEGVALRVGGHDGYARLVFDWTSPVHYKLAQDGAGTVTVTFDRAAAFTPPAIDSSATPQLSAVTADSAAGAPLSVRIAVAPGSTVRDFTVGDRVVIDIAGGASDAVKVPPPAAEKKAEKKNDGPPVQAVKAETVEKTAIEQIESAALPPHVISLSLTEAAGMVAFEKDGNLWLVFDRPDIHIMPELAGPDMKQFTPFKRYDVQGGVAFMTHMPAIMKNAEIYGEGGALVWRLVITPQARDVRPAEMTRSFQKDQAVRGGTAQWPIYGARKTIDVPDPETGAVVKVVTVETSDQFAGPGADFIEFTALRSIVGLAVMPKIDDIEVGVDPTGIKISRPGGLTMSRSGDVSRRMIREDVSEVPAGVTAADVAETEGQPMRRIFDFDRWMMGGLQALEKNQHIIMAGIANKDKNGKVQDLLTLAKMNIANDRGQEATGFLSYAADELPAIAAGPEYRALRGVANALAGKFELALQDLQDPALKDFGELDYWRAYTLAWLEDWQQAQAIMPSDDTLLRKYPKVLLEKVGLKLAEVALRNGNVKSAQNILSALDKDRGHLWPWTVAGLDYLQGEAYRQHKETDKVKALWEPLVDGHDDLYRARAGLALTMLEKESGKISPDQAIDRLEGLRYAWRGDELEARIGFMLGQLYLDQKRYLKGFAIMRDSAALTPDSDIGREITSYMQDRFKDLMLVDNDLSALDAVMIYEEFIELTPPGDEGNKLAQKLAERLVETDLLDRAAKILRHQVDFRLDGHDKARIAERLAAIYLLDREPEEAAKMLDIAQPIYESEAAPEAKVSLRKIDLMRARALSQMNKTEEALAFLSKFEPGPDVNRLRADIAWQAGLWEDAAEALQDMILDQALDLGRPLAQKQADLILNRAVALNLSGNRVALANLRKRYEEAMKNTARARLFDVVTRPRQSTLLADRQTLQSIVSEVDIFKEFLDTYKDFTGDSQ